MILWILYMLCSFVSGYFFGHGLADWILLDHRMLADGHVVAKIIVPGGCMTASTILQEMARKEFLKKEHKPLDKDLVKRDTGFREDGEQ